MRKLLIFCSLVISVYLSSCSVVSSNITENITGTISSTFIKPISDGEVQYIVNFHQTGRDVEPFLVENTVFQYNRTERFAELKELEKSNVCVNAIVYGVRIPMFTYRAIYSFKSVDCK